MKKDMFFYRGKWKLRGAVINKESIGETGSLICNDFSLAGLSQSLIGWAVARGEEKSSFPLLG